MNKLLALITILSGITASAVDYDLVYMTKSGAKLDAQAALLEAAKGETIYRCQTVETKISKSGTSISLKNVKKPKTEVK